MSDRLVIRTILLSAAVAAISATAGYWIAQPGQPAYMHVTIEPARPELAGTDVPQYDSGDPRFVVDPDGDDEQSANRSCDAGQDCDDHSDDGDPADAVWHT